MLCSAIQCCALLRVCRQLAAARADLPSRASRPSPATDTLVCGRACVYLCVPCACVCVCVGVSVCVCVQRRARLLAQWRGEGQRRDFRSAHRVEHIGPLGQPDEVEAHHGAVGAHKLRARRAEQCATQHKAQRARVTLRYATLRYVMLRYAALCCAMLRYAALCCTMLCYASASSSRDGKPSQGQPSAE